MPRVSESENPAGSASLTEVSREISIYVTYTNTTRITLGDRALLSKQITPDSPHILILDMGDSIRNMDDQDDGDRNLGVF